MDRTFQKFLRSGLDLAPLGVERREENLPYFCTPKGAAIFGWAGVDGIHYCFIRGFGGMVFAVSPMNAAPDCVHPLARDFADFLRLLLACGDAAALEQAWMWGEAQFDAFLRENPPTAEQEACLAAVAAQLGLTPMEHPWAYLRELQASFDPGSIKYTEEFTMSPDVRRQNQRSRTGRSSSTAASGADGETAGPGPSSGWKRSLTGRGAIGSSPRRMPAARGWSWTSACAQRRTRSAGS